MPRPIPALFPPYFNPMYPTLLRKSHRPFFTSVRNFILRPRDWDFTRDETVALFNEKLNNAIHEDITRVKNNFNEFREKLQLLENVFQSFEKAQLFFQKLDEFLNYCLHRQFVLEEYESYVKYVGNIVDKYELLKKRNFTVFGDPIPWPGLEDLNMEIPMEGIENLRVIKIETGQGATPNRDMANKVKENFNTTILIYTELILQLTAHYQKLGSWIGKCTRWLLIKRQLEAVHDKIFFDLSVRETEALKEYKLVESFVEMEDYAYIDWKAIAKISVEYAQEATKIYKLTLEMQQDIMRDTVYAAYVHAVDVIEEFTPFVTTEHWTITTEAAENERDLAAKEVYKWKCELQEKELVNLYQSKTLNTVLDNLPLVYDCIAHFIFKYLSPY